MRVHVHILALLLLAGASPAASAGSDRVYVSAEHAGVVAVLDGTGKVVQRIAVGTRPRGLRLSPDGRTLYVAVSGSPIGGPGVDESKLPPADHRADGIAVVDVASGKVTRTLRAGTDPETFTLSPDGRTLYVSNEDEGAVSAVSADGRRPIVTTKVGDEPEGAAVTPDGQRLFVACEGSDHVAMLDARTLRLTGTIPFEGRPRGLLMSADGATVFAAIESAGKLAAISTADGKVRFLLDLAAGDDMIKPMGMVEAPDGHLFVTTGRGGAVIEIDPRAGTIVRRITGVGARPWGIGITADGRELVTANGSSNDVSVIDRASGQVLHRTAVAGGPWGIAVPGVAR